MPHQIPGLRAKNQFQSENVFRGFANAIRGILAVISSERNFRIHLSITLAVFGLAAWFNVTVYEWLVLLLLVALVLAFEAMNTAIEVVVDILTGGEYHEAGGIAKDMSAGACFILANFAIMIGLVIFVPYFRKLLF